SYREVFARDLYEAYTGLLVAGDVATAQASVRFLFDRQQQPDGRFPRNSLLNGKKAPDTGGDQLDESSYPILMAWQAGLAGDAALWPKIRAAADFVVAHGPSFGSERWEEQGGFSPSTFAAEIAGLVAAARIADLHGAPDAARVYRATADHFQRSIKGWTVTSTGPYGSGRYFIRLSRNGDPNAAISYGLGNGSVTADQRSVGRRLPGVGPARHPARPGRRRDRHAADRGPADRSGHRLRPGLLPVRHRPAGLGGRVRRLLRGRPDELPDRRPAVADRERRVGTPVAGAVRRAGRACAPGGGRPGSRRPAGGDAPRRFRSRPGARADLGGP